MRLCLDSCASTWRCSMGFVLLMAVWKILLFLLLVAELSFCLSRILKAAAITLPCLGLAVGPTLTHRGFAACSQRCEITMGFTEFVALYSLHTSTRCSACQGTIKRRFLAVNPSATVLGYCASSLLKCCSARGYRKIAVDRRCTPVRFWGRGPTRAFTGASPCRMAQQKNLTGPSGTAMPSFYEGAPFAWPQGSMQPRWFCYASSPHMRSPSGLGHTRDEGEPSAATERKLHGYPEDLEAFQKSLCLLDKRFMQIAKES